MLSYSGFSQSLIPYIIKEGSKKHYCYDSTQIRKVAQIINDGISCDSVSVLKDSINTAQSIQISNLNQENSIKSEEIKLITEKVTSCSQIANKLQTNLSAETKKKKTFIKVTKYLIGICSVEWIIIILIL